MQYLYDTDDALVFMDNETYDQIEIQKDHLEWEMKFMKPNDNIMISMYEGEILGIILPDKVELQIVECEPAVKGDTATSASKMAKLETGLEIRVPLFKMCIRDRRSAANPQWNAGLDADRLLSG